MIAEEPKVSAHVSTSSLQQIALSPTAPEVSEDDAQKIERYGIKAEAIRPLSSDKRRILLNTLHERLSVLKICTCCPISLEELFDPVTMQVKDDVVVIFEENFSGDEIVVERPLVKLQSRGFHSNGRASRITFVPTRVRTGIVTKLGAVSSDMTPPADPKNMTLESSATKTLNYFDDISTSPAPSAADRELGADQGGMAPTGEVLSSSDVLTRFRSDAAVGRDEQLEGSGATVLVYRNSNSCGSEEGDLKRLGRMASLGIEAAAQVGSALVVSLKSRVFTPSTNDHIIDEEGDDELLDPLGDNDEGVKLVDDVPYVASPSRRMTRKSKPERRRRKIGRRSVPPSAQGSGPQYKPAPEGRPKTSSSSSSSLSSCEYGPAETTAPVPSAQQSNEERTSNVPVSWSNEERTSNVPEPSSTSFSSASFHLASHGHPFHCHFYKGDALGAWFKHGKQTNPTTRHYVLPDAFCRLSPPSATSGPFD